MNDSNRYTGVIARTLREDERLVPTSESMTPLVIEPEHERSLSFLEGFCAAYASELMHDLAVHGAILLRGFNLQTTQDFERAVLGIRGMQGMPEVLMAEPGRRLVEGARYVMYTNAEYKTGGTLDPPIFHHENYYVPDVPRFISFFCLTPSWFGGETGLVNMAGLYADLPAALRAKLECRPFAVRQYPLRDLAKRYRRTLAEVHAFCARNGLPLTTSGEQELVWFYKPSVLEHPTTHERALAINLSGELGRAGLGGRIVKAFAADYAGLPWSVHRFHWKRPMVIRYLSTIGGLFVKPRRAAPRLYGMLRNAYRNAVRKPRPNPTPKPNAGNARVGDLFEADQVELLATSIRRRFSSFTWKRGDVLIIDNVKTAHAGMPGFGPRNLKALLCNRLTLPFGADTPGVFAPRADDVRECLGAELLRGEPEPALTGSAART